MNKLPPAKGEWLSTLLVYSAAGVVAGIFFWLTGDILVKGLAGISWNFLTTTPENAGRAGGIAPILVSTVLILAVCLAAAVPIGLGTAIFLSEFTTGKIAFAGFVRRSLDVLASVPSIIFGLFGNAFFSTLLGLRFSILSGGLTLACMVLPILIRTIESGLRAVPKEERLAAAALGLTRWAAIRRLLLPSAAPALLVGLMLCGGRAIAETAALIFTSGYVDRMPGSLFDSGRALSLHIYDLSMNVPGGDANAYASALVLISLLLTLSGLSVKIVSVWRKKWILLI